jgi:hypothetical protein
MLSSLYIENQVLYIENQVCIQDAYNPFVSFSRRIEEREEESDVERPLHIGAEGAKGALGTDLEQMETKNYEFPINRKIIEENKETVDPASNPTHFNSENTDLNYSAKGNMDPNHIAHSPFTSFLHTLEKRFFLYFEE